MAGLFNEISVGRYNRLLQRLLQIKGSAPAPQLSGDIASEITLESDRPEWMYLKGENRYFGQMGIGANAANNSRGRIRLGSAGVLAVVERIIMSSSTSQELRMYYHPDTNVDLGNPETELIADNRLMGSGGAYANRSAITLSSTNADTATNGTQFAALRLLANSPFVFDWPVVFSSRGNLATSLVFPSPIIDIRAQTVNTDLNVTVCWRERAIEESEFLS